MLKTEFVPLTIIDNFFDDPEAIRKKALSYSYGVTGNHPGYRSNSVLKIDPDLYNTIANKIFALFVDTKYFKITYTMGMIFQWTPADWEKGWVHTDSGDYLAGVVYLTPNPPSNSGTLIYEDYNNVGELPRPLKYAAYSCRQDNINSKLHTLEEYKKEREENNSNYKTSITIENVYNRAVIYPANYFHAENNFFGKTIEDSRLALLFFLNHVESNGIFPIDRFNEYKV